MGHILWVEPVFKEMIWGGNQLKEKYGYAIPSDQTGECWAPSAHPNGDNTIKEGEFKGQTLSKVFDEHRELFGNIKDKQFPLLVKIIDACNDLSVQVHPNDEYAALHENSLGKTECWYVLDCKEDTKMVMGHHAKTKEELVKAIENDDYDHLLNKFDIKKGDFFYIPSGTIHAICKGSLIYEAQQSSDITYRVYDYHRKDKDGNERELHLKQAIDCLSFDKDIDKNDVHPVVKVHENMKETIFISNDSFTVSQLLVIGKCQYKCDNYQLATVVKGSGKVDEYDVKVGDNFLVPTNTSIELDGQMMIMMTTK